MESGVFVVREDGTMTEMMEDVVRQEEDFQQLLEEYPALLSGKQIDPASPRRWLLVSREMPVPGEEGGSGRWSLDHLFLDQDGVPTLVEVKRKADTRIRREVVGQMLDYAANGVVYWPVENIRDRFNSVWRDKNEEPEAVLNEFLIGVWEPDDFWSAVEDNLKRGRIRMLFVADEIPAELQRIVEFLNEQMNPAEVLAVEIKQFSDNGLKVMVPKVIGRTAEAQAVKSNKRSPSKTWDLNSFMADLSIKGSEADVKAAKKVTDWAVENNMVVSFGKGAVTGTMGFACRTNDAVVRSFTLFSTGKIEFDFSKGPFKDDGLNVDFRTKLNGINGIEIPEPPTKFPQFPLAVLHGKQDMEAFLNVCDWLISVS